MSTQESPAEHLVSLCGAMGVSIDPAVAGALVAVLDRMLVEPQNLTSVAGILPGVERHLADSLAGLVLPELATASSIVDVGSGGGFPGLPLAAARPDAQVTLVESERRKAEWLRRASVGFPNVSVVAARSEELASRMREAFCCATARALAPFPTTLELAAPLVSVGGHVVVWRGIRDDDEEASGRVAAAELGLEPTGVTPVQPFPGAHRHLHLFTKVAPTSDRFPRRPGRAAKRPLG